MLKKVKCIFIMKKMYSSYIYESMCVSESVFVLLLFFNTVKKKKIGPNNK